MVDSIIHTKYVSYSPTHILCARNGRKHWEKSICHAHAPNVTESSADISHLNTPRDTPYHYKDSCDHTNTEKVESVATMSCMIHSVLRSMGAPSFS